MYFTQKNEYTIPLFINAKILLMHDVSTASAQLTYVIYLQKRLKQKSTILISNDVSLTLMIMHHFQILKVKFLWVLYILIMRVKVSYGDIKSLQRGI